MRKINLESGCHMRKRLLQIVFITAVLLLFSSCGPKSQTTEAAASNDSATTTSANQPAETAAQEKWPVYLKASELELQPDRFVPLADIGTFNRQIITEELLQKPSKLPEATVSNIPYWTGFVCENMGSFNFIDPRWAELTSGGAHFYEDNVKVVADEGFNCLRVVYSLSYLSSPDDPMLINEAKLECLDQLIAWGMKYDVHIMLSIMGLPGKATGLSEEQRSIYGNDALYQENVMFSQELFTSDAMAQLYRQYMEMLVTRYQEIPSRNFSIELLAEPSVPDASVARYEEVLLPIVQSLHSIDPNRILIANDVSKMIPEQLAAAGCALSLHTHIYAVNGEQIKDALGIEYDTHWPMEYFPSFVGSPDRKPMTLVSENGFDADAIEIYFGYGDMRIQADGKTILETGMHDIWANNDPKSGWETAQIPQGTKEITIGSLNHASAFYAVRLMQGGKAMVTLVSHEMFQAESETDPMPTIRINPDGTTENIDNPKHVLDAAYLQARFLQSWIDCAKKYNVGFLLTEVGTDTRDLTQEQYAAYEGTWLQLLKDNHIPWMYNCLHGVFAPQGSIEGDGQYLCGYQDVEQVPGTPFEKNRGIFDLLKLYE